METTEEEKIALCPPPLQEIINEFREAAPRERLDYLLEYAMNLPDLPERLQSSRDEMEQVHECQTPVFLHTEIDQGKVAFFSRHPARIAYCARLCWHSGGRLCSSHAPSSSGYAGRPLLAAWPANRDLTATPAWSASASLLHEAPGEKAHVNQ